MTCGLENRLANRFPHHHHQPPPNPPPRPPSHQFLSDLTWNLTLAEKLMSAAGSKPLFQSILPQPSTLSTKDVPIYNPQEKFYREK